MESPSSSHLALILNKFRLILGDELKHRQLLQSQIHSLEHNLTLRQEKHEKSISLLVQRLNESESLLFQQMNSNNDLSFIERRLRDELKHELNQNQLQTIKEIQQLRGEMGVIQSQLSILQNNRLNNNNLNMNENKHEPTNHLSIVRRQVNDCQMKIDKLEIHCRQSNNNLNTNINNDEIKIHNNYSKIELKHQIESMEDSIHNLHRDYSDIERRVSMRIQSEMHLIIENWRRHLKNQIEKCKLSIIKELTLKMEVQQTRESEVSQKMDHEIEKLQLIHNNQNNCTNYKEMEMEFRQGFRALERVIRSEIAMRIELNNELKSYKNQTISTFQIQRNETRCLVTQMENRLKMEFVEKMKKRNNENDQLSLNMNQQWKSSFVKRMEMIEKNNHLRMHHFEHHYAPMLIKQLRNYEENQRNLFIGKFNEKWNEYTNKHQIDEKYIQNMISKVLEAEANRTENEIGIGEGMRKYMESMRDELSIMICDGVETIDNRLYEYERNSTVNHSMQIIKNQLQQIIIEKELNDTLQNIHQIMSNMICDGIETIENRLMKFEINVQEIRENDKMKLKNVQLQIMDSINQLNESMKNMEMELKNKVIQQRHIDELRLKIEKQENIEEILKRIEIQQRLRQELHSEAKYRLSTIRNNLDNFLINNHQHENLVSPNSNEKKPLVDDENIE